MTRYLVGTTSIHTTAAACDYLQDRLDDSDVVVVLGVADPSTPERDLDDAVNVARARLAPATVETRREQGTPGETLLAVADDEDVSEIIIGPRRGTPEVRGNVNLGSTVAYVAARADRPVVIVPFEGL